MPPAPTRSELGSYLDVIREFPLLTPEEEQELARAWRDRRDPQAAERLVNSHLRLVAKVARGYSGYGLPLSDLIAEGNVGMMQAINGFDPDRGCRLTTYALWWIRAAIQEYILRSWSLVRLGTTSAEKKLFFNLRRTKGQLQCLEDGDLPPEQATQVATLLNVPEIDVVRMNRRLSAPDHSLNLPPPGLEHGQWQDWLADPTEDPETALSQEQEKGQRQALLRRALAQLKDRERHILAARRLREKPVTLDDLSRQYGISRERVRQIEAKALQKLAKLVRGTGAEPALAPA